MDKRARRALKIAQDEYDTWKDKAVTNRPFNPRPLIKMREGGDRPDVYRDSEGKLTAGTGHLLTESELKLYKEGDTIPQEKRDKWFEDDSFKAVNAAAEQAREIGVDDLRFMENLTSVNFQLGTNWNKEHVKTWDHMKAGNYDMAATEAADSKWFRQTPKRVEDFQRALKGVTLPKWTYDIPKARY